MSSPLHPNLRPVTRALIVLLVLSPLALAVPKLGRSQSERALAAAGEPVPTTSATTRLTFRDDGLPKPLLGFAINAHHISRLHLYLEGVDTMNELGANTLIVVTPMFQKRVNSNSVRHLRTKCPTDQQLIAILKRGKQHGMYTVLMPIILIEDPGEKDWRGVIQPKDWNAWWRSYDAFIDRFVGIANATDVDMLSIGSELNTTEDQLPRWERIVGRVRSQFQGKLTYSSNWDRYHKVTLWPLVDVMSVSSYFELERDRPGAPESDLVEAWAPVQRKLLDMSRQFDKPLLLSELGYPSLPWANAHPWNYVPEDDTKTDHEAQARCWRAFFRAWSDTIADPTNDVLGFCGYRWDPYRQGGDDDTGYGIVGKPAFEVIRNGYAEIRRKTDER